jgi:hypothetical protein
VIEYQLVRGEPQRQLHVRVDKAARARAIVVVAHRDKRGFGERSGRWATSMLPRRPAGASL